MHDSVALARDPRARPLGTPALGAARAFLLDGRHLLRDGARAHEGELDDAHGSAAVPARLRIGKRPVADDAGAHGVASGAPLRPPGDAHALGERDRAHLSARSPGTQGELGNDEPAQHVGNTAGAEARLGERGEKRTADRGEALVGEDLDLCGVAEAGHVVLTSSMEPTGVLEHGRLPE